MKKNILDWHKEQIITNKQKARRSSGIMRSVYSDAVLRHKKALKEV